MSLAVSSYSNGPGNLSPAGLILMLPERDIQTLPWIPNYPALSKKSTRQPVALPCRAARRIEQFIDKRGRLVKSSPRRTAPEEYPLKGCRPGVSDAQAEHCNELQADGGSARALERLAEGALSRGDRQPGPPGRHRFGEDLHHRQRDRGGASPALVIATTRPWRPSSTMSYQVLLSGQRVEYFVSY
jgi:hypothetical protein